jgi:hypothetical protein
MPGKNVVIFSLDPECIYLFIDALSVT